MYQTKGIPIVVSAASGTGKTSLCLRLLETLSHAARSISYTTRQPRGDEVNGRDYHFVDDARFDRMIEDNEFLEWASVFDRRYGTGFLAVDQQLAGGVDVLLDIDVQGGIQIKERWPHALTIFLLPPSMDELRRRLLNRATEAEEAVEQRLAEARKEIDQGQQYDVLIVNDDFEQAAADLRAIIRAERIHNCRPNSLVQVLLNT
ncbi:MAG: guanylate kinase [Myxococcales bacterium]|nr:guanylate kinase [Myxococcales bacterium]